MYELFFKALADKAGFTAEEMGEVKHYLTPKKLRKKQYLLQEGDVCKFTAFIEKGALRSYLIDEKGSERIIQFALEGWTISDLYSFLTGEPATYNIDALEDTEMVLINRQQHEEMLLRFPKYEKYMRIQLTGAYISLQQRITSIISSPLADRYTAFAEKYPEIVQRVPQHMIASYMGLTPETLSRVRKKISGR